VATLAKIVKHPLFKDFLKVLVAFLGGYASGCALPVAKSPAHDVFQCRVALFAPYVAEAAPQIVAQIEGRAVNPVQLLLGLGVSPREVVELAKAYQACDPGPAAAEPDEPADAPAPAELLGT